MTWAAGLSIEVEVNRLMGPSVFIGVGRGRPCIGLRLSIPICCLMFACREIDWRDSVMAKLKFTLSKKS